MARIPDGFMTDWKDGDTIHAPDYKRERDGIVLAVNDIDDTYATASEMNDDLLANQTGDHLGTWQGLTPSDISIGLGITPDQIGAASEEDLQALADDINNLKSLRYNMNDFPRLEGEMDDTPRIQRAIDSVPVGAELTFPSEIYTISSGLSVDKGISFNFEGTAKVVNNSSQNCFTISGETDATTYAIANTITRGAQDIPLKQFPIGYAVGDMLAVEDSPTAGSIETHEIRAVTMTSTNLVTSPAMTVDTNADGVVDGFTSATATGATATYALSAAQKISLTASTQPSDAAVLQANLAVTAGQPYSLLVQAMAESIVGTFKGQIVVEFFTSASVSLGATTLDFSNTDYQSIELHNLIAPATATKATISFKAVAVTTGDTGVVYFKTAQFLNSATKITVQSFIRGFKPTTTQITKVIPVENVQFKNFNYQMMEGATQGYGVSIYCGRNISIDGLVTTRRVWPAIFLNVSMDSVISRINDTNPQSTGYPSIMLDNGTSRAVIKDSVMQGGSSGGYVGTGHDITFDNNTIISTSAAGIYASVWGYATDVFIKNCRMLNVGYGVIIKADDFADPIASNVTLQNFLITDCLIRLNSVSGIGVYARTLLSGNGLVMNNVHVQYLGGSEGSYGTMTNYGVQVVPGKTKATITNCLFEGLYSGVKLYTNNSTQITNDDSNIIIRDCTFKNGRGAIDIANGLLINLLIHNMMCDNLSDCCFDNYSGGTMTYSQLVIDGMSLVNSPGTDVWWDVNKLPVPASGDSIRGIIRNIRTDRTSGVAPAASYNLTLEDLFFTLDGQTLYLRGTAVASNTTGKVFPDGLVDGQTLQVLIQSGSWVINKGSNIFFKTAAASITLATTGSPVASFIWMTKGTPGWYQIS